MEKIQFKTNINCGSCLATVTPFLNAVDGIEKWEVNTQNKDKILVAVATDGAKAYQIINAINKAGFRAERI